MFFILQVKLIKLHIGVADIFKPLLMDISLDQFCSIDKNTSVTATVPDNCQEELEGCQKQLAKMICNKLLDDPDLTMVPSNL